MFRVIKVARGLQLERWLLWTDIIVSWASACKSFCPHADRHTWYPTNFVLKGKIFGYLRCFSSFGGMLTMESGVTSWWFSTRTDTSPSMSTRSSTGGYASPLMQPGGAPFGCHFDYRRFVDNRIHVEGIPRNDRNKPPLITYLPVYRSVFVNFWNILITKSVNSYHHLLINRTRF